MLSIEALRAVVAYDHSTGQVVWIARSGKKSRIGQPVGSAHSQGYREASILGHRLFVHRVVWALMTGAWPVGLIDHINGDRADNRWSNLRLATPQMNSANMRRRPNNRSGFKGVVRGRNGEKWLAFIHVSGKTQYLGTHKTPEEAHQTYLEAAKRHFGDFARSA
jgi:hypothetical protein